VAGDIEKLVSKEEEFFNNLMKSSRYRPFITRLVANKASEPQLFLMLNK